jgi:hypothetical protein
MLDRSHWQALGGPAQYYDLTTKLCVWEQSVFLGLIREFLSYNSL